MMMEEESFKCSDLKLFEKPFYYICLSCMFNYIAIINSIIFGSATLQQRYQYDSKVAGIFFTMPYVIAAICSPILGWYVDTYGKRMTVTLTGSALMGCAHTISILAPDTCTWKDGCPYSVIPLVLLGLSYTTYAVVLWGTLPYMVEARTLGTAFGICTSFQNFGTVIAPPIIGMIYTYTQNLKDAKGNNVFPDGYIMVEAFFIVVSILGFIFNFLVYVWDSQERNNLLQSNMPMEHFERYIQQRNQDQKELDFSKFKQYQTV